MKTYTITIRDEKGRVISKGKCKALNYQDAESIAILSCPSGCTYSID
jgi:hypothetical protein